MADAAIRAVLFDFDGTLADSYDAIAASVNHVRAYHQLSPLSVPDVRRHVGHGPGHLLAHTVGVGDPQQNDDIYRAHHPSVMKELTSLLPGADEMLTLLRARGVRLGVCSNKPVHYTLELLDTLEIGELFEVVLGPEDVQNAKPAPDMLLLAVERLKLTKPEILYVGDMTVDIETARAAGIRVWVVPTGSDLLATLEAAQPDRLITGLGELPSLIAAIGS